MIPIVHVNGFKISERTIYGTMDDLEMLALFSCVSASMFPNANVRSSNELVFFPSFSGYGYQVRFVEDLENLDQDMAASLEWALEEIRKIQTAARQGNPIVKPRWPVLILRTPKVCNCFCLLYYPNKRLTPFVAGHGRTQVLPRRIHRRLLPLPPSSLPQRDEF